MSLKNTQYDVILREYNQKQLYNKHELDLRTKEVYMRLPAIKDIDAQIVKNSMAWARHSLTGSNSPVTDLAADNARLSNQKLKLLKDAGYPANYLDLWYSCPDCHDTGYINDEKCHCFLQSIVDLLYLQSNVRNAIIKENFDTFSINLYTDSMTDPSTGKTPRALARYALETAHDFVNNFDESFSNLLILGNTGVGKTFLTNCIAKALLDNAHTVIYLTSFQFFDILEKHKFNRENNNEDNASRYEYIMSCDLLIIDDLGTELVNSLSVSQLYGCVNERLLSEKATVISTNLSLEQIKNTYSERVFSRLVSNYRLIKLVGEDIRLKKRL